MATFQNRIMARSPYYITATAGTPTAFGTVTCVNPLVGNNVDINGLNYIGVSGAKANNTEFDMSGTDTQTSTDLADSITQDSRSGTLNDVTATSLVGVVTMLQTVAGAGGNSTTLVTSSSSRLQISGALFTGGGDGIIESAVLQIWVWEGSNAARPTLPVYTISKDALTSTSADIIFEISELIRDSFIHETAPYGDTPDNWADALWVETELDIVQEGTDPATVNNLYIAFDGFGYFEDGVNPLTVYDSTYTNFMNPITRILDGTMARLSFYVSTEPNDGIHKLEALTGAVVNETIDYSTDGASVFSFDRLAYYTSTDAATTSIRLYFSVAGFITIPVEQIEECKYPPKIIIFYNKEGLGQHLSMFKLSKEAIRTKRDDFQRDIGFVGGSQFQYDVKSHQIKDFNVTGRRTITLNSDYLDESQNDVFKQLLLSEFISVNNEPVTIKTSNLDFKTTVNNKLIQYTIRFEYANELINNV